MTAALVPSSVVVASREQVSTNLSGEAVILGMRDGVYYGLDPVGARIWALMQEPRALDSVADTVAAEYDVNRERAMADLLALAGELVERGLVDIVDAPTA
ncbi:MAG: PqqD family protein [Gemmatimonadales bacterium]